MVCLHLAVTTAHAKRIPSLLPMYDSKVDASV